MKKGINILFIYPNTFGMNMLPPAIATFSAILKKEGHQVKVFDTTYYAVDHGIDSDGSKEQGLNVVPYQKEMEKKGLRIKDSSWRDDVTKLVNDYHPDILILSSKVVAPSKLSLLLLKKSPKESEISGNVL